MENFTQKTTGDIQINIVNLLRAGVNEAAEIKNLLEEQIIFGYSKIVIDLSQCTQLDSTFIGSLVVTQKKLLSTGGELKLVDPLDPAKEMFYLTGISKLFGTYDTLEEAVKSFGNIQKIEKPEEDKQPERKGIAWAFA